MLMFAPLIPTWLMALIVLGAVAVQVMERKYEHAVGRMLLFGLYAVLTMFPDISIEVARFFTRYFLVIIFLVEIISSWIRAKGT